MSTNKIISIITPVYNMESLLPKCIKSVLQQSHKDIEFIIVDDGSTDSSPQICDEYESKDRRIKVKHQLNQGIACAINSGLDMASGDYILFVDSDDYIAPQLAERLLQLTLDNDADITQCGTYAFKSQDGIGIQPQSKGEVILFNSRKEILEDFIHHRIIKRNLAARLFKKSLFDDVRCEPGRMIVDAVTLPQLLVKCNKYVYVSEKYYYVYERSTSVSRRAYSLNQWEDCKYGNKFIEGLFEEKSPSHIDYALYRYVYTTKKAYLEMSLNENDANRETVMSEAVKIYRKNYPAFIKTEYYRELGLNYRCGLFLFMKNPKLYSTGWRLMDGILSRLGKLIHKIKGN